MEAYFAFALILALTSVCATFADQNLQMQNLGIPPEMTFIGTVDGKSYYSTQIYANWTATQTYCNNAGMEMATITSKEQQSMLLSAFDFPVVEGTYWLGARDAMDLSQFAWDVDNSAIDSSFIIFNGQPQMLQCLYVFIRASADTSYVSVIICDIRNKILCQLKY